MDTGPSTSKCYINNDFNKIQTQRTPNLMDDKSHFGLKRPGTSSGAKRPRISVDDYKPSFSDNTDNTRSQRRTNDGLFRRVTNTVSGLFSNSSWSEWLTGSSPSTTPNNGQHSLFDSSRDVSSDSFNASGTKKEKRLLYPEEGIAEDDKIEIADSTISQPISIDNSWVPIKNVIPSYKEDQSFMASTPALQPYLAKRGNNNDLIEDPALARPSTSDFHRELLPPRDDSVNALRHSFSETHAENYSTQTNVSIKTFPSSRKRIHESLEGEANNGDIHSSGSKKRTLTESQMFTEDTEVTESMKRKRPRFSISTYGSPFNNKTTEEEPSFSIFYPGTIMYGGASNHQRKRNRIIRRKICPRTPAVVSTNDDDHSDGGLSSAARRILDCIDKISTPLSDSKRAFQFGSSRDFSFNSSSYVADFHKNRPIVKTNTFNKDSPPVAKLLTPSKVKITKNFSSLFASKSGEAESSAKEVDSRKEIKENSPESKKNDSSVNTFLQKSSENLFAKEKMGNKDMPKNSNITQNSSIVTSNYTSKSSSIYKFPASGSSSVSSKVDTQKLNLANNQKNGSFSIPQIKEIPTFKAKMSTLEDDDNYKFSNPAVVSDLSLVEKLPKSSVEFKFSHPINEAEVPAMKEAPMLDIKESGYIIKKNKWNCDTCLLQNDDSHPKCIACEAPKPQRSNVTKPVSETSQTWGTAYKKPLGSWECESCLLQNKSEDVNCSACSSAKPRKESKNENASDKKQMSFSGSWGETFKRSEGSWDCPQCLLQNKSSVKKCASCEAPKPSKNNPGSNSSKPSLTNWGDAFKPSEGSWVCDSCLVHNTSNCTNCLCCKAARPKKEAEVKTKSSKEITSFSYDESKNKATLEPNDDIKEKENIWNCPECLSTNNNLEIKCTNCKCSRPIPANNLFSSSKAPFTGSFPSQFKKKKMNGSVKLVVFETKILNRSVKVVLLQELT